MKKMKKMKNNIDRKLKLKNLVIHQKYLKIQRRVISYAITELTQKINRKDEYPNIYQVFQFQKVKLMAHKLNLLLQRRNIAKVQAYLKANAVKIQKLESYLKGK